MSSNSLRAPGLLEGAAGQAIAQTLQGMALGSKPQQPQQDPNMLSMNSLPSWINALANERQSNAAVNKSNFDLQQGQVKAGREQQALDLLQRLGQATNGGQIGSPEQKGFSQPDSLGQLGYAMALMGDTSNSAGSFASSFDKRETEKNQMVLATFQHDLLNANIDPNNPEAGVVALLRNHSPEDLKALAAATKNDPKVFQDTLNSVTNMIVTGKMNMIKPVLNNVVDQLDELYKNPGTSVLATHEKTADKTLSSIIGAASQQFIAENPNTGMTPAQVSQMVHQMLPQGLASLKTLVDIDHVASSAFATRAGVGQRDQEIGIAQQNADTNAVNAQTAQQNANTAEYSADQGLTFDQQIQKAQETAKANAAAVKPQVIDLGTTVIDGMGPNRNGIPVGEKRTVQIKGVLDPSTGQYIPVLPDGTKVDPNSTNQNLQVLNDSSTSTTGQQPQIDVKQMNRQQLVEYLRSKGVDVVEGNGVSSNPETKAKPSKSKVNTPLESSFTPVREFTKPKEGKVDVNIKPNLKPNLNPNLGKR